jgi:outer membrane protein TolC
VDAGKFAEIDLVFNEQLIAERKGKVLETQQKFRASTFKLSLFLRDESGEPMVPDDTWLPELFPAIETPGEFSFPNELAAAISRRPEPQVLELEIRQLALEQQLASNNLLPRVDVLAQASQDIGTPASSINDKGQFEMVIGLQGEVPIQRRKARGKIQSTQAKIAQLSQKLRMQSDKIGTEIRIARNSLELSASIVEQAEVALRASLETLTRYQFAFEKGKADLIYINLLETKLNESEIKLVEAQRNWFVALAELQAILGLDPLDQAFAVSQLPNSNRPGPGRLPTAESNADDEERE